MRRLCEAFGRDGVCLTISARDPSLWIKPDDVLFWRVWPMAAGLAQCWPAPSV